MSTVTGKKLPGVSSRANRANFDSSQIPDELKRTPQWVCFRLESLPGRTKPAKIPIDPATGERAACDDPRTWGSFQNACDAVPKFACDGVGFQFSESDPFCGIDLDGCVDESGQLSEDAGRIVAGLNSYSELSPSGKGVHVIVKAKLPEGGRRKGGTELYDHGRYFTVSGKRLPDSPTEVCDRQAEVESLHAALFPKADHQEASGECEISDDALLDRIRRSKQAEKFDRLWNGDPSMHDGDDSKADLALCQILAFWTAKDSGRIERLFNLSKQGEREKWRARSDYRERTISRAIELTTATYEPGVGIPFGFRVTEKGVFFNSDEEALPKRVCSELRVIAEACDENEVDWHVAVEFANRNGNVDVQLLPRESFGGDGSDYRKLLCSWGVDVDDRRLLDLFLRKSNPGTRAITVERIGWHDDRFVLPDAEFGTDDERRFIFLGPERHRHAFNERGTADEWRREVGRFCSGNSRLLFAASCAFAGPLLAMTTTASPGFHLVGGTSLGKTTALEVAGSVCGGGGTNGFLKTWRATSNGVEVQAQMHNHALLCLDEMGQVDPKQVGEIAYMLCNGQGKMRMRRNTAAAKSYEWQIVLLSSGEVSLEDHATEAGKKTKAGQRVRVADVPADAGVGRGLFENVHAFENPAAFANHLKRAARTFYGTTFRELLDKLSKDRLRADRDYGAAVKSIETRLAERGEGGEVARAALHFALIGAAGEIATRLGVTGFKDGECDAAAVTCFDAWIERRGTKGSSDENAMVRQVRLFFERHGDSRFEDRTVRYADESYRPRIHNRAGFKIPRGDEAAEFLVFPETFKTEVSAGFDHGQVAKVLRAAGFLARDSDHMQARRRIDGEQGRFYVVSEKILGEVPKRPQPESAPF